MAKRPSVKEILEAARRGGPAQPAGSAPETAPAEDAPAAEESQAEAAAAAPEVEASAPAPAPPANVPSPSSLGRPLTLKEKLAAARAGGAAVPGAAPAKAAAAPIPAASEPSTGAEPAAEAPAEAEQSKTVPAPAASIGRPLTLKEKLAAARSGGATPAPAAGAAKPAAAKAAAAPAAKAAAARTLPPLEKITDPKDLAEALRQSGAKRAKESAAAAAAKTAEDAGATPAKVATAAKAAGTKESKPQSVLPKPSKAAAARTAPAGATAGTTRRAFPYTALAWIWIGWAAFSAGVALFTAMCGRFMFPNVLAEPPSTVKVGLPSNFEPEEVNERFKSEWGFWIVRSTRYNGTDIIYALSTICTHLGCPPNWLGGEQKFKCPCHGSGFYISGVNFEGPAPRPLERFKVSLADDGQMIVDKSQKFQQELDQWSDPDSFLNA